MILFVAGLGLLFYEIVVLKRHDKEVLLMATGMLGLPGAQAIDRAIHPPPGTPKKRARKKAS